MNLSNLLWFEVCLLWISLIYAHSTNNYTPWGFVLVVTVGTLIFAVFKNTNK